MAGSKRTTIRLITGRRLLLLACVVGVLVVPAAQAAPGTLDPSFGTGGTVTTSFGSSYDDANAAALQPDGKIVAAGTAANGDFALARYNPEGSLDTSFNGTGKATTPFGSDYDDAYAVALQPDGKIVAAGSSSNGSNDDFALARYNPDGSLDAGFGSGGKVTTSFGSGDDDAYAVALQPDGKIVAAGSSWNGSNYDFALARYNTDGSLDASLNGSGKVTTSFGSFNDSADAVALQPDGKIVAAGISNNGTDNDFALARYSADGSLDTSFNGTGKVTTSFGSGYDAADSIALQPDGKIVAAGYGWNGSDYDFALARYNTDGSLDTSFDGSGKATTSFGSFFDVVNAVALQPDGKIVAAGSSGNGSNDDFALARYDTDGALDASLSGSGKVTTSLGSGNDVATAAALQPDGKLVVGRSRNGASDDFALARYLGSSLTVTRTGSGSGSVTSNPGGIDCGSTCSAAFAAAPVTLTATPATGSSFLGWSGACSGTGTCTVTIGSDQAVTARFEADKTLAVAKAGGGTGTVTSSPAGISCGASCTHAYTYGTSVTLTATAAAGSSFAGWSGGACTGTSTCTVKLDADTSVTATFAPAVQPKPQCIVPKVKGKTLQAAKKAIKQAHCSVGTVTRAFSATVKKGRVSAQKPRPGSQLNPGAKVRLKVSKGKKS